MNYKAVIFDLDGTLLDSLERFSRFNECSTRKCRFPVHDVESYKYFVGDGMEKLVFRTLPEKHGDAGTPAKYTEKMKEEYSRRWNVKTKPYKGIASCLTYLPIKSNTYGCFVK